MQSLRLAASLNRAPEPELLWLEAYSSFQIPSFQVIGLPGPEVAEARERVRAAILSSGFEFPRRRLVLNLSPASVPKQGTGLDLAMALTVLAHQAEPARDGAPDPRVAAWGELGLDGALKPSGHATRVVYSAWKAQIPLLILPSADHPEACRQAELIARSGTLEGPPPRILAARDLKEAWELLVAYLEGKEPELVTMPGCEAAPRSVETLSLLSLRPSLERILSVAVAGAHHVLLLGPKGTGKSHALEWLEALHPPADPGIRLQQALLRELVGDENRAESRCPVRRVSPQARPSALCGGAGRSAVRPGELSLAHGGLLIADEFPEWPRDSRECLREPMEHGFVHVNRARGSFRLPSRFVFAATGNFCPCGGWPRWAVGGPSQVVTAPPCRCSPSSRRSYLARISGPMLDRIDLLIPFLESASPGSGDERREPPDSLARIRERIETTRASLMRSWGELPGTATGATIADLAREVRDGMDPLPDGTSLRGRHKRIRVALTLAAWDGAARPASHHWREAALYRSDPMAQWYES